MTLSNGKTSAYQWDIGLTVPTTDAEGTVRRFTNEHSARSIPVACAEDSDGNMVYAIPNILLTTGRPIIMFTLAGDNDGIIYTDTQDYLPVYPAPKPDDYVFTDAEINLWKSLCDRMDTAESNISTNATNIGLNTAAIAANALAIGTNTNNITTLQGAMSTAQSDISALKSAPHIYRFPLEENGGVLSTTATFAEVVAAFQRGDYIVANAWGMELTMLTAQYTDPPDEDIEMAFTAPWPSGDGANYVGQGYVYCELHNGTWTLYSSADTLPLWMAPDISDSSNYGKVPVITSDGVEWQPQSGGSGLTDDAKDAILQIARKVAYIDSGGETYYNELYDALYPLASISAVYTQSGTVYDTDSLDSLKSDLVVTGTYGDGGTSTIPSTDYTLAGTLTAGTSTITVTYDGKTATFTVTVTHVAVLSSISAVYTQSGTVYSSTSLDSLKTDLVVTAHYDDSTSTTVPGTDYTLSGTLTTGTSTITVSYGGMTTTFTVTVSAVTLVSISAVYTQGGTVYETASLDSLKTDLVVTATYSDTSTATIPGTDYTLSGSLTVGTSTITVSYGGETDTFSVSVTADTVTAISAVYTQSGTVYDTDSLGDLKTDLVVTATYADSSTGIIAAADYTLSGTLTPGSSTITATYGGESDTFSVTVTDGFVYTPAKGLLSNQSFITVSEPTAMPSDFSESISGDALYLYCPTGHGRRIYLFSPSTYASSCTLTIEFKVSNITWVTASNANTGWVNFFTALTGGDKLASAAGFARYGSSSADVQLRYKVGGTLTRQTISTSDYHTIKVEVANGKQTITFDGVALVTNASLADYVTSAGVMTGIVFDAGNTNNHEVYIKKIEYQCA